MKTCFVLKLGVDETLMDAIPLPLPSLFLLHPLSDGLLHVMETASWSYGIQCRCRLLSKM